MVQQKNDAVIQVSRDCGWEAMKGISSIYKDDFASCMVKAAHPFSAED